MDGRRFAVRLPTGLDAAVTDGAVVGRGSGCDIVLAGGSVSRRHARFHVGMGTASIEDLESYNGVLVNDRPVVGRQALAEGDRILIGEHLLVFESVDSEQLAAIQLSLAPTSPPPPSAAAMATTNGAVTVVNVVLDACARALGGNDLAEASRSLEFALAHLSEIGRDGGRPAGETVDRTAMLLVGLAAAVQESRWVAALSDLHVEAARMPTPAVLDAAISVCGTLFPGRALIGTLLEALGERPLSPPDRARLDDVRRTLPRGI